MKNESGLDHRSGPMGELISALAAAEDSVSRLDERTRSSLGKGLNARLDLQEACAWSWNRGELVHLEDLVLHDELLDVRAPDQELTRSHAALRLWRRARLLNPEALLSPEGVFKLVYPRRGRTSRPPEEELGVGRNVWAGPRRRGSALRVPSADDGVIGVDALMGKAEAITTEDDEEALAQWFALGQEAPASWPPLLRAAVLLEMWATIDPLPRHGHVGAVLVNALVRRWGRLKHHELRIEIGRRRLSVYSRRPDGESGLMRVIWQLQAIAAGESFGLGEQDRISLARQVVALSLSGRRSSSRLGEVIELFTDHPVVTASMIAERLKVSQQGARGLIAQLGAGVSEISGRSRFRVWRL